MSGVSFPAEAPVHLPGLGKHNPDILTCLANLSADEVFTPPKLANAMLDVLPPELWSDPEATFLDPFTKSGVFLREIASRLNKGLASQMPDDQKRIDHILTRQVFGIATSELTWLLARRSLYCSKKADGKFSIVTPGTFDTPHGNVRYPRTQHQWNSAGRCEQCGANRENYERGDALEAYAYPFIHGIDPQEEFGVKFDVIVGNPPYQLSDGGHGRSASPIYDRFVRQAKKLEPRYLVMVIPSRWFAGGKGLDEFREEMLADRHIRRLIDYENFSEVFPGVDLAGGVCYFLWDRNDEGDCNVTTISNGAPTTLTRKLDEFPTFIRNGRAVSIVKKVSEANAQAESLATVVSSRKPFGIEGNHPPRESGIPCWFTQRVGRKFVRQDEVKDTDGLLDKWKLLIPYAPIAGQTDFSKPIRFYYEENTRIAKPGECCAETYLVAFSSDSADEVISFKSYLFTKVVRFLLLQTVTSQHVTRKNFGFVPHLGKYKGKYTDEMLCDRWGITSEEWDYIDSRIG